MKRSTAGHARTLCALRPYERLRRYSWRLMPRLTFSTSRQEAKIRLWTLQPREVYEVLRATGRFVNSPERSSFADEPLFQNAYGWMLRQMNDRLETRESGVMWCWAHAHASFARTSARLARDEVWLTLNVARERVLVIDFADWHLAINAALGVPRLPGEGEDDWSARFDRVTDAFYDRAGDYDRQDPAAWPRWVREALESSWEGIFDVTPRRGSALQATIHELRAEDVVRAVRLL